MGRAEDVTVAQYSPGMLEAQDLTLMQMWEGERKKGRERMKREKEAIGRKKY